MAFRWQGWKFPYRCLQPRFGQTSHYIRVNKTKRFLSPDRRSSSVVNSLFKSNSHPKSFPRWHSLYNQVPNSVTFKVYLTLHKITCSNLDILSTMYYFLKDKDWSHLNLEDIAECRIMSITRERQLKLELNGNIFVKLNPSKLARKLSSNSLIQQLTMFYFAHVYELNLTLLGLGTLFLLIIRNSLTMLLLQTICLILSLC